MRAGIEVRDAHFPGRAPIDAYGNGGFRFADMSHRGSVLLLPSGIYGWTPHVFGDVDRASLKKALEESEEIDVLLFGCGKDLMPLPAELRNTMRESGIGCDVMSTGAAVRTYNVLLAEERKVAKAREDAK